MDRVKWPAVAQRDVTAVLDVGTSQDDERSAGSPVRAAPSCLLLSSMQLNINRSAF